MADRIHLSVVSAGGVVLDRMVHYVHIPLESGSVGVLAGHMPMLCAVKEGVVRCTLGQNETIRDAVKDGIVRVSGDEVVFLVSGAEIVDN